MHQNIHQYFIFPAMLFLLLIMMSCKECPTEPKEDLRINLELIHSDCVSALLKVSMDTDSLKYNSFLLENKGDTVGKYNFHGSDTVMWLTNLSAKTEYSLVAFSLKNGQRQECSDTVRFTTMAPSTKQFTTEVSWFNTSYCVIHDVWLFDENNIWAGGDVTYNHQTYMICYYNGTEWLPLESSQTGLPAITGMFAFSEQNIWVAGHMPVNYKDSIWTRYDLWEMGILPSDRWIGVHQIWGSAPDDVYFAGDSGAVLHYDGQKFSVMETGTKFLIRDIDGDEYGNVAVVANEYGGSSSNFEDQVLLLKNGQWKEIFHSYDLEGNPQSGDYGDITCLDVYDGFIYIHARQGIIKYHIATGAYYLIEVRMDGMDIDVVDHNDIMTFSGYDINYYNGVEWTEIIEDDGSYYCGRYNGSIGCMAGFSFCVVRLK